MIPEGSATPQQEPQPTSIEQNNNINATSDSQQKTRSIIVPIKKTIVCEANVRKHGIKPTRLQASIESDGIKEPPNAWYNPDKDVYEVTSGQHRLLGARAAGKKDIELIVHLNISTLQQAKEWCWDQAVLQEDIGPLNKAQIAVELKKQYGSLGKAAKKRGYKLSTLKEWYTLRNLSSELIDAINNQETGRSPTGSGNIIPNSIQKLREIAKFPKDQQLKLAQELGPLNGREFKKRIRELKTQDPDGLSPLFLQITNSSYQEWEEVAKARKISVEKLCEEHLNNGPGGEGGEHDG